MRRATQHIPSTVRARVAAHLLPASSMLAVMVAIMLSIGCAEERSDGTSTGGATTGGTTTGGATSRGSGDGSGDATGKTSNTMSRAAFDDAVRAIETYIGANRTREAEIVARKLVASAASDPSLAPTAHEYAARACFARAELGDDLKPDAREALLREAAAEARRAVEPAPLAGARASQPSVDARRFAAMLADRIGDRDDAQRLYDAALSASPDDTATLLPAALSALARDAKDPRIDDFVARHERLAPDAAWSAGLRAEVALARGDAAAALVSAERALALDREMLEMRLILAKALRANARSRDAARLLSALSPGERARTAIAQQFALALAESGELVQAASAWDAAIRAQPADPYVRAEAALAFLRAGDEARAASELEALDAMFGGAVQRARIEPLLREIRGGGR